MASPSTGESQGTIDVSIAENLNFRFDSLESHGRNTVIPSLTEVQDVTRTVKPATARMCLTCCVDGNSR